MTSTLHSIKQALILIVLILLTAGAFSRAWAEPSPPPGEMKRSAAVLGQPSPFVPTVSREESELLNNILKMAETNLVAAIGKLTEQDLQEASAALDFVLGNLYYQNDDQKKPYPVF